MKLRKTAAAIAVVASVALLATACSSGGSSSTSPAVPKFTSKVSGSMRTDGMTTGDEVATSRVAYAAKQLKGVTITLNKADFDPQKFAAQLASGDVPDVVQMDRSDVAEYAAKGLIYPLDQCYSANNVKPDSHYYPAVIDSMKYQGKIYGIPQFWQTAALMLNMRVLDKAGVKASDFDTSDPSKVLAAVKKLTKFDSSGNPTLMGLDPNMPGNASSWFLVFGGKIMDANGKPTLNDANNIKALTWLKKLYNEEGGYDKAKSFSNTFDYFGNDNQFAKDQVAAEFNQQWYPNVLTGNTAGVDISGIALKNPQDQSIGIADGAALVIPKGAKNPSAACKWALDLTSDGAWITATKARLKTVASTPGSIFTGLFTGSSTADKIINDQYMKPSGNAGFDQVIAAYNDSLKHGVNLGSSPAGLDINTELQNAIVPALEGSKTVKEALDDAQAAAMLAYKQDTK
jgi:multiple sugar transport system substrate-binding protein